jgi:hypothetical protein
MAKVKPLNHRSVDLLSEFVPDLGLPDQDKRKGAFRIHTAVEHEYFLKHLPNNDIGLY